ncbi:MAG TPA: hypothetical protein VGS58_09950, partial [Candidatus Sulfopaludibacter sp.]|nr:hypothetical protein [Candidatus Sulfopaludibacter sp.]
FGALPRLRARGRMRDGWWLGLGLAMHLITRPYESVFLFATVAFYFAPTLRRNDELRRLARPALAAAALVAVAAGVTLLQNARATHSWSTLPEMLSQYQYGVPASLTFQADPVPHRELTPQQALEYQAQLSFRGGPETLASYLTRLEYRVRFLRFFFLAPLYLALPFFFPRIREYPYFWAAATLLLFALGVNFFPAFQFHYIAALACLFILAAVTGLERLSQVRMRGYQVGADAARLIVFLCSAHFALWYGVHLSENGESAAQLARYETWDDINHQNPRRRIQVARELAQLQGKQLVFVRYWPRHIFQDEWVYNDADIDASKVVWARDLGAAEDEKLRRYYPDRSVWLLEPDATPPILGPYVPEQPERAPEPAKSPPHETPHQPTLRFEQVH